MTPEELFENNQKLVYYVTKKLRSTYPKDKMPLEFEDMVQVGMIGLWKASNGFKPELKLKFSSYAVPTIMGEILKELRDKNALIKVPRPSKLIWKKILKSLDHGGQMPTVEEVQEQYGCNETYAKIALELFNLKVVSDSAPINNSEGKQTFLSDILPSNVNIEADYLVNEEYNEVMSLLNDRERFIFEKMKVECTQGEIGEMLGISQAHVSRMYRKAVKKIKKHYEEIAYENEPQLA